MFASHRHHRSNRQVPTFQPGICVLEDRVVPAGYRHLGPPPPPPPAVHLQLIVPSSVQPGQAFMATIEAENAKDQLVTTFTGNVRIALGTADPGSVVPASFNLTAANHGKFTIPVTLQGPAAETLIATSGSASGQASVTVAAAVTHFGITVVAPALAGDPTTVQVSALDANNNVVPSYRGTVHFADSDPFAPPFTAYTFKAADNGSQVFALTFTDVGYQTFTVTDAANASITGSVGVQVTSPWAYYYPAYYYGGLGFSWF